MTKLLRGKTLIRETGELERGDAIVVELHLLGLNARLKGNRRAGTFFISYGAILDLGRKLAHRDMSAAKVKARRSA